MTESESVKIKNKKTRKGIGDILFYTVLILIVLGVFSISANSDERKSVFGYHMYNVLSGSMQPDISKGSLIVVKQTDAREIEVGKDITFYCTSLHKIVTHRVVEILPDVDEEGYLGFKTKGVGNPNPDKWVVHEKNVVGVVAGHVPFAGFVLDYIANHLVLIGGLLLVFMLLCNQISNLIRRPKEPVSQE